MTNESSTSHKICTPARRGASPVQKAAAPGLAGTPLAALLLATLIAMGAATCDDAPESRASAGGPGDVPAALISGRTLDDGRAAINVDVPSRHHAYLDAGKHGNLIPIGFDWQGLSPEPEQVTAPVGERDEDVQAQVLRGSGTYVFKAGGENAPPFAGRSLRVRSQICDEDKGICYRPTWTDVKL
ncbi:MAG: protein-disulfide reductase DsbD N-terminal domain-containing protein [bacterium]|nr:protein-disulfide reductase DsbD N-terminal domain-containing protein [bacterium]